MKIYLFPVVIGGFILTFVLQAVMFASVGLQSSKLQAQLDNFNKKIDKIQLLTENEIAPEISKIKLANSTAVETPKPDSTANNSDAILQTLGLSTDGNVTLKASWNSVEVFETSKASSKVVGKIEGGKSYQIVEKAKDWFQIKLTPQVNAWVQAQFVYETI